jgi:hypothetical protein
MGAGGIGLPKMVRLFSNQPTRHTWKLSDMIVTIRISVNNR